MDAACTDARGSLLIHVCSGPQKANLSANRQSLLTLNAGAVNEEIGPIHDTIVDILSTIVHGLHVAEDRGCKWRAAARQEVVKDLIARAGKSHSVSYAKCPSYPVLYMQSALLIQCYICKVPFLSSAIYAKSPCYPVLYMQSALLIQCYICKVSLLSNAIYAKCPCYPMLYYAKCPYYPVLRLVYMQSVLIILYVQSGGGGTRALASSCKTPPTQLTC